MCKLHKSISDKVEERKMGSSEEKGREVCFCLPSLSVSLSQSHAQPFCLTARLCSLRVISVDQSAGGREKKKEKDGGQEGCVAI